MMRRPLTSTLFPYTTLFRSILSPVRGSLFPRAEREPLALRGAEDRKSTRLNSSHVEISYAVFCLKKKKQVVDDPRCAELLDVGHRKDHLTEHVKPWDHLDRA